MSHTRPTFEQLDDSANLFLSIPLILSNLQEHIDNEVYTKSVLLQLFVSNNVFYLILQPIEDNFRMVKMSEWFLSFKFS